MPDPRDGPVVVHASGREAIDYVVLADALSALGYPMRLELLDLLRFPHSISELRVSPSRQEEGTNPERPVARQTVQYHLEKLLEGGFVREEAAPANAETRAATRYLVNPQRLYAVTEELRALSLMFSGRGGAGDATGTVSGGPRLEPMAGPRLVLVHGVYEGKQFALTGAETRWTIGRRKGLPVCLDYDPFVSLENAVVEASPDGFVARDVAGSKNGTSVNWTRLPRGGSQRLRTGDLVGVGRSLLLFRDD